MRGTYVGAGWTWGTWGTLFGNRNGLCVERALYLFAYVFWRGEWSIPLVNVPQVPNVHPWDIF